MNVHLLVELWDELKPFIAPKERLEAADKIVSVFDERGLLDGIEYETGFDKHLSAALATHHIELEGDYDEDTDW